VWVGKTTVLFAEIKLVAYPDQTKWDGYFCSPLIHIHFICILPTEAHFKET